ncbi:methyl-accepting chemotaxis protein [Bradyrhizobium sp. AZCC 1721]
MAISFGRLRIMPRILCALLVPSLGLLLASSIVVREKAATVGEMQKLSTLAGLATRVSGLVHEMQRERGASAVFLGSKGEQLKRELPEQRLLTDAQRQTLGAALKDFDVKAAGGQLATILDDAMAQVARLEAIRQDVSSLKMAAADSNVYFTTTIGRLLDVGLEISQLVTNVNVARTLSAYSSFMQAKERSGQERATGAPGFAAGKFNLAQYRLFAGVVANQNTYFALFKSYATSDDQVFLATTVVGEPVTEVDRMRKMAIETSPGEPLSGADGAHWYKMTTARIDLMKKVEDHLAGNLLALAERTRVTAESAFWTALGIAAAVIILTGVLGLLIVRSIIRPLIGLTSGMKELAGGNFGVVLPGLDRKDEIGDMAFAIEAFKLKAADKARDEAEARIKQDQIAAGQRKADMSKMADDFEAAVGRIVEAVSSASSQLEVSAGTLTSTAERAQELATTVASASEEASTNVQSVASATEEMASSVTEISRQVQESARMANDAVEQARTTNDRVSELSKAATRIGDVVELINTIAGQTNLLALNATIEAARAGEAGRGFAVVASEVKALAEQTAKATGEIGQQITGIQAATQESVNAIQAISGTIEKLSEISSTIAAAVEEQGAATQEISRNVQQAAMGTQQVSSNITDVQRGASETGSASSQVLAAAQSLSGDSNRLKLEVGRFLDSVRAA